MIIARTIKKLKENHTYPTIRSRVLPNPFHWISTRNPLFAKNTKPYLKRGARSRLGFSIDAKGAGRRKKDLNSKKRKREKGGTVDSSDTKKKEGGMD